MGGTHEAVLDALADLPPSSILDAPAGEGALAHRLTAGGHDVVCLDLKRGPGLWLQANLNDRLPFDDAAFDAVACVEGIEHVENPWHLTREFARVLRPGGTLALSTPNVLWTKSRMRFLWAGHHLRFKTFDADGGHVTVLTYPQLRLMLERAGFERIVVRTRRLLRPWRPDYWLVRQISQLFFRAKNPYAADLLRPEILDGPILVLSAEKKKGVPPTWVEPTQQIGEGLIFPARELLRQRRATA